MIENPLGYTEWIFMLKIRGLCGNILVYEIGGIGMKKLLALLLTFSCIITLVSCGDTTTTVSDGTADVESVVASEDTSSEETSSEYTEDPSNVALYKRTYRSSESKVMPATYITDGKDQAWSSDTTTEEIDEWVAVDLGKNYNIDTITVKWGMSYSPEFSVEISRGGVEYTEIYSTKESSGGVCEIPAENSVARYIRVRCKNVVSVLGTFMGATIQEIEVEGEAAEDQTLGNETDAMVITKVVSIEESDVTYGGRRVEFNTLAATGATFEFQCTGRAVGAYITAQYGTIEVSIDGGDYQVITLKSGTRDYLFTDQLGEGTHTVRIMRRNESWDPVFTVDNIIIEETGEIVKGYKGNYDLKIEFIGDSLTSAQGIDYSLSYVVETCRILNAQFHVIARGGMGLYKNAGNGGANQSLPYYYQFSELQGTKKENAYNYHADLVVINIGGNDAFNLINQITDTAEKQAYIVEFEKRYYELIDEVLVANPNAAILCTCAQLVVQNDIISCVESVAAKYKADHPEVKIDTFRFAATFDRAENDSGHPGPQTHKRDGQDLAEKIKEFLKK